MNFHNTHLNARSSIIHEKKNLKYFFAGYTRLYSHETYHIILTGPETTDFFKSLGDTDLDLVLEEKNADLKLTPDKSYRLTLSKYSSVC